MEQEGPEFIQEETKRAKEGLQDFLEFLNTLPDYYNQSKDGERGDLGLVSVSVRINLGGWVRISHPP